jgi:hypothetical protein
MSSIALGALSILDVCCRRGELMRLGPKLRRNGQWIDPFAVPPGALVAAPVELTMMQPADRDGEAVAHLPRQRPRLRELDVMGIRGGAAADQARLGGDKFQMPAIAVADRFADNRNGFGAKLGPLRLAMVTHFPALGKQGWSRLAERAQPGFKGGFDSLRIRD